MSWSQAVVLLWIQFAGAAGIVLLATHLALRRVIQPAERIRLIQLALIAVLAIPGLVSLAPWPVWRIEVVSSAPRRDRADAKHLANGHAEFGPLRSLENADDDADATKLERLSEGRSLSSFDASHSPTISQELEQESVTGNVALPVDAWTWAAICLLGIHAVAAGFFVLETVFGAARLRRLCRDATPASPAAAEVWQTVTETRGRRLRLLVSSTIDTPLMFGWLRPCVILPRELAASPNPALRSCLAHEWSHIERGDIATWRLAWFCQLLLWYQPLFWRLRNELRVCQDMLADARSTGSGENAIEYAELLLAFAKQRSALAMHGALMFADRPSHLTRRITMLLQPKAPLRARCTWQFSLGAGLAALLAAVLLSGVRLDSTRADDPTKPQPSVANQEGDNSGQREPTRGDEATRQPAAPPAQPGIEEVAADELAGTVVDVKGKPVPGVTVDAWHWYPGNETKTDEKGRFRLKGLDSHEKVEVLFSKEGYSPQHFPQRPTGAKGWVITLGQKTYFEGAIVGTDGKPVGNAEIRASFGPVEGDGVVISEVTTEGKSREDGSYRLYVAPGVYDVQISAGERGVFRQSDVAIEEDEAKALPVRLQRGVRFEARVVDSVSGQPVEGFILWRWRSPRMVGRSNGEGKIVFEGLNPGRTEFNCGGGEEIVHESGMRFFQHGPFGRWWSSEAVNEWQRRAIDDTKSGWQRNFDDLEFDLSLDMPPVTIVVEAGVTIAGRVTDPQGKPVEGATVAPARTGSGNSLTGDTRYSEKTDKDGKYVVVLPASNQAAYNLIVHDGEYGQWRNWANGVSEPMQTKPGQKVKGFDLQLSEPATIRGRVVTDGRGVGDREVRTHSFDKRENRYYDPTTRTKPDGTFELKFVRPGKHFVQASPFWINAEQASEGSKVIEVKAGELIEGVELEAAAEERWIPNPK